MKRNYDINLPKIVAIEPYTDGIGIKSSGRERARYFLNLNPKQSILRIEVNDRKYRELFSGVWLAFMIEGAIKRLEESK